MFWQSFNSLLRQLRKEALDKGDNALLVNVEKMSYGRVFVCCRTISLILVVQQFTLLRLPQRICTSRMATCTSKPSMRASLMLSPSFRYL